MATPIRAGIRHRLLRRAESFVERGRKGGGFELFRGGYAKCIVTDRGQRSGLGGRWAGQRCSFASSKILLRKMGPVKDVPQPY